MILIVLINNNLVNAYNVFNNRNLHNQESEILIEIAFLLNKIVWNIVSGGCVRHVQMATFFIMDNAIQTTV